jgi:hypothetical protein
MDEYNVLDILHEMLETERSFYGMVRFLDGNTRNHIVAAQIRNASQMLAIMRGFMAAEQRTTHTENIVMNIPLNTLLDPSGNFSRNFLEPVPVVPTRVQISAATESGVQTQDTTCAICQEHVAVATRIRACRHAFHPQCINEWFTMNTRCPICRHDIRDLQGDTDTPDLQDESDSSNNDNRMHPNEE